MVNCKKNVLAENGDCSILEMSSEGCITYSGSRAISCVFSVSFDRNAISVKGGNASLLQSHANVAQSSNQASQ